MEKGKVAGNAPVLIDAEAGKNYAWCTCGLSDNQPFCNGAHKGSDFTPQIFSLEEDKKIALCTCKQTSNPPYCDGAHKSL
jgi:CDGSH-type Zn-finger protein